MTQSSPHDLEREAERRRSEMAETAEQLRAKLTPGQLIDELAHTFRDGDMSKAFTNLKTQVRDNPLALALVGAGVACLVAGVPGSSSRPASTSRGYASGRGAAHPAGGSAARSVGSGLSSVGDKASAAGSTIGEGVSSAAAAGGSAARAVGDGLSSVGESVAAAGSSVTEGLSSGMSSLADAAQEAGDRTRDGFRYLEDELAGLFEREPLVLGAVGLALGAAAGALLPRTRFEDRHLGEFEAEAREAGTNAARSAMRKAGDVASAVGKAAVDEADSQGLMPERGEAPLAERLGKVAERSLDEARGALSEDKSEANNASRSEASASRTS